MYNDYYLEQINNKMNTNNGYLEELIEQAESGNAYLEEIKEINYNIAQSAATLMIAVTLFLLYTFVKGCLRGG